MGGEGNRLWCAGVHIASLPDFGAFAMYSVIPGDDTDEGPMMLVS